MTHFLFQRVNDLFLLMHTNLEDKYFTHKAQLFNRLISVQVVSLMRSVKKQVKTSPSALACFSVSFQLPSAILTHLACTCSSIRYP